MIKVDVSSYLLLFPRMSSLAFKNSFNHLLRKATSSCIASSSSDIIPNSVVIVSVFPQGVLGSNPGQSLYFCYAFDHLILCYGLCSEDI